MGKISKFLDSGIKTLLKKDVPDLYKSKYGNIIDTSSSRSFSEEYPQIQAEHGELLTKTIDGHQINPTAYVVGRQTVGGDNMPMSYQKGREVTDGLGVEHMPDRFLGKNTAGLFARGSDNKREIVLSNKIETQKHKDSVGQHEIGHAIDDLIEAGAVTRGVAADKKAYKEALDAYNELNNNYYGKTKLKITPSDMGYSAKDHDDELIGEALRLYQQNPGYIKEKYPNLAKKIREVVNPSNVGRSVQFNSMVGVGLGGYLLSPDDAYAQIPLVQNPMGSIGHTLAGYNGGAVARAPAANNLIGVADAAQKWSDWREDNLPGYVNFLLPGQPDPEYIRNRAYGREPTTWEKIKFGLSFL